MIEEIEEEIYQDLLCLSSSDFVDDHSDRLLLLVLLRAFDELFDEFGALGESVDNFFNDINLFFLRRLLLGCGRRTSWRWHS